MHAYTSQNSVFDGPVTNLLAIPPVLIEVLSPAYAGGGGGGGGGLMISNLALLLVIFRMTAQAWQ